MIKMLQSKCLNLPPEVLFEIFDTVIVPTVTYAHEIWGYKVQVLGKCSRFPIFVKDETKCVLVKIVENGKW